MSDARGPQLTIRSLRSTAVLVPMAHALGTSAQSLRSAPLLLIDLETEEGITGHTYLWCYIPVATALIARVLEELQDLIQGDRVEPDRIGTKVARQFKLIGATGILSMAMGGLDVVCWDALSVAAGVPLVKFLGGSPRPIPAYNSSGLGLMAPEACADEAEELLEGGFRAVKLRLGYPTLAADLAAVRAVRKRLPANVRIMTDYNQTLAVEDAIERARALDHEDVTWIEEPIRHDDYTDCARIASEAATPIQIGENFWGPHDMAAALDANACDLMMVDLCRIGGVTGWRQAASLAARTGMKLSSHLFPEVSSHLLAASPTSDWLEYVDWASPILAEPPLIVDGNLMPTDLPGTGVSWNTEAVARYRIE